MPVSITSVGNAGFLIAAAGRRILVDAYFDHLPHVGTAPLLKGSEADAVDVILVTHSHPDHFNAAEVAEAQRRTSALVCGPLQVTRELVRKIPSDRLLPLEPAPRPERPGQFPSKTVDLGFVRITAFRTSHGSSHNSYLLEIDGRRIFDDCDNEDTARLPVDLLKGIDILFVAPWHGSGWVEFVDAVQPRNWILMHLTQEEIELHAKNKFLQEISDHIPSPSTLRRVKPGESLTIADDA